MITLKKNLKQFVDIMNIVRETVVDVSIHLKQNGMFIKVIHPSNHMMGLITIKKDFFDEYNIEKEQIISVDTNSFQKIVKKLGKKELKIDLNNNGSLLNFSSGKSYFNLNTYNIPEDDKSIPKPEFESIWNINIKDFFDLILEHLDFSDVAKFVSEGDKLKTIIKSRMISGEVFTTAICDKQYDTDCYYDIKYLSLTAKTQNLFDKIIFSFGKDTPCKIEADNDVCKFEWFLAPRVGDE